MRLLKRKIMASISGPESPNIISYVVNQHPMLSCEDSYYK
jgi:hypothetical protein